MSKRKRVLIAESDGFTRMVLMLLFRMIGFGVDFTANGLIALGKLRSQPPDALLLELNLSGLAGLELIRWVRSDPQFSNLRIYVFTDAEAMKRAVRKEVQLNVTKVFDKRSTSREDVVKNIILDLSTTEVGIRLHLGPSANRDRDSSRRMVLPGEFDQLVQGVRAQANAAARCKDLEERLASCRELLSRVSSLRSCAEIGGLRNLERQARGLAGFLNQLCRERKSCTDARLNTVRSAVDVLGLLASGKNGDELAQFSAVIVDESSPSGKGLGDALTKMGINAIVFADPGPALEYLGSNWVNFVVVNLPQPELHGLDLASIQQLALHTETPVISVSEVLGADPAKERPGSVPLVNQNPLLLHEVVLLGLNQVYTMESARHAEAQQEPAPPVTTGPIPFGNEAETEASATPGFSSLFTTLRPGTTETPAELQAWGPEAPADDERSVPSSQPEHSPGETAENGQDQAIPFIQNDEAHTGDLIAEEQFETPSTASGGEVSEEVSDEQASRELQTSASDPGEPDGLDQQPAQEFGNAAPEAFGGQSAETEATSPAQGNFEAESGQYDAVAPVEASALSSNPETNRDDEVQALQLECAELRVSLGNHESERETLVNRIVAAENKLHDSQTQIEEYKQTVGELQKQLEEAKAREPDPEATQRLEAAESELSRRTSELEQARSLAETQTKEHEDLVAELRRQLAASEAETKMVQERCGALENELVALRRQLEASNVASRQNEAVCAQAQSKIGELEKELAGLRQARDELDGVLKREQENATELRAVNKDLEKQLQSDKGAREAQIAELEQQIAQGVANLARVTAALSKETGERQRSDERAAALNLQLQELHAQSGRFLEGQRADQGRIANLEEQVRRRDEAMSRSASELEQHKSEGRLLKEQLQKTRELNGHFRKNLSVFKEAHQKLNGNQKELQERFEGALEALQKNGSRLEREMSERHRLAAALETTQRELQAESRKRETLENELRSTAGALKKHESRADHENAERQRLQQALESARLSHSERSRRAELDLSKAQAALEFEQVERKRREAQLARMRWVGLEATRRARLLRNTLQKHTREPLDDLYQSARRLLQLELGEDQKKLAEAMLQDALLLRTRLQEPEQAKSDANTPEAEDQPAHAGQSDTDEFSTKFLEKIPLPPPLKDNER